MTPKQHLLSHLQQSPFGRKTFASMCKELEMDVTVASRYLRELREEGLVQRERMGMNTVFKVVEVVDWGTKEIQIM